MRIIADASSMMTVMNSLKGGKLWNNFIDVYIVFQMHVASRSDKSL